MPDGKVGIRIVKFGFVRHLFSLLAQQVSGVQADVRIVNQNADALPIYACERRSCRMARSVSEL
nr:hypothetical protein [Escherichia coli]